MTTAFISLRKHRERTKKALPHTHLLQIANQFAVTMADNAHEKGSNSLQQPQSDASEHADEENDVKCPAHTTDKRLMMKIDLHVLPFLCIMYLLAFLGKILKYRQTDLKLSFWNLGD